MEKLTLRSNDRDYVTVDFQSVKMTVTVRDSLNADLYSQDIGIEYKE
ncbi:MAG: hypothetical protein IJ397_05655 [Lachnospiraceae bacterium]|nr:hypothetical protein [Lachnospiraceae bacterium]